MSSEKRPIGLISIDTKTLFDRLIGMSVGETVSYQELNGLIGRDVRSGSRWVLDSARRKALNEQGAVFGVVAKVGVKRLSDLEIVNSGEDVVGRIHRTASRGARKLTAVSDFAALPNDAKIKHNTYASLLGVMAHVTKGNQVKRLTATVEKAQAALPLQKTLEAFRT